MTAGVWEDMGAVGQMTVALLESVPRELETVRVVRLWTAEARRHIDLLSQPDRRAQEVLNTLRLHMPGALVACSLLDQAITTDLVAEYARAAYYAQKGDEAVPHRLSRAAERFSAGARVHAG